MVKNRHAMDGVSPPTNRRRIDDFSGQNAYQPDKNVTKNGTNQPRARSTIEDASKQTTIHDRQPIGIDHNQVAMTKDDMKPDKPSKPAKQKRRWFGLRKAKMTKAEKKEWKKNLPKHRKILRKSMFTAGTIAAVLVVFVGLKGWTTLSNVIDRAGAGSPLFGDAISPSQLAGEGDGRVNIMLIGISGEGHTGANLADTLLVASIDPINNEAGLLSVPRDLLVAIPGFGDNKINAAHSFGEDYTDEGGIALTQEVIEETLGIPIHYYIRTDLSGLRQSVDAVGGITINLDEQVSTLYSPDYGRSLTVGPGEVALTGEDALLLGRNRQYTEGDVVRNDVQRQIILAVKDKVLSLGTIANPLKLIEVLDSVGGHVRTNLQPSDMLRLRDIAEQIPGDSIISYGLSGREDNFLIASSAPSNGFVWVPRGGDYSEVQDFVRSIFVDGFIKNENAIVDVLNATGTEGLAGTKADELASFGYTIGAVGNSPKEYTTSSLFDINGDNPFTKRYLEQRFVLKAQTGDNLPSGISTEADFVIILGNDADTTEE